MNYPKELFYTKSHEWLKYEENDAAVVGITDYAQDSLGDLVFINLPEVGDAVSMGESFADVESVKAVSDVISPVTGSVCEVNEELMDEPEKINESPYEAWFIKVENVKDHEELLTADEYEKFLKEK
ncbi:MAG: glycine cleavage system protein GcvH [Clostridiales bacterium]|jgi:glycine cleavage system H protein|nr:glycine cleavage system protein GcvH [Clostridiales bacterium]